MMPAEGHASGWVHGAADAQAHEVVGGEVARLGAAHAVLGRLATLTGGEEHRLRERRLTAAAGRRWLVQLRLVGAAVAPLLEQCPATEARSTGHGQPTRTTSNAKPTMRPVTRRGSGAVVTS